MCKIFKIKSCYFASTSSVYGENKNFPLKEEYIPTPVSFYAATKICNEILAQSYSQMTNTKFIGLRFFTVYGPRGRPDMAPYKFLKAIMDGEEFKKYGDGSSMRDYTYIDDIVDGVLSALENNSNMGCEVINLGNSSPVSLNEFIETCVKVTKKKAIYQTIENQLGDVPKTYADITKAKSLLGYNPKVSLEEGLRNTYQWLVSYKKVQNENLSNV
jgi:UDP-glucuronate 4-epimerase